MNMQTYLLNEIRNIPLPTPYSYNRYNRILASKISAIRNILYEKCMHFLQQNNITNIGNFCFNIQYYENSYENMPHSYNYYSNSIQDGIDSIDYIIFHEMVDASLTRFILRTNRLHFCIDDVNGLFTDDYINNHVNMISNFNVDFIEHIRRRTINI